MNKSKIIALVAGLAMFLGSGVGSTDAVAQVMQDNTPGSFLVFPKFDIRGTRETQLRIVNSSIVSTSVKLNYVCPGEVNVNEFCSALDRVVDFTPFQTRIVDVRDQNPPCEQGFVVGFAINSLAQPISYNFLTGSYHVSEGRRHEADNAISIQSVQEFGSLLGAGGVLRFGGGDYVNIGTNLVTDFRAVSNSGVDGSRLVLLDLNILAGMQNPRSTVFIDFWNAAEVPFSTSHEFICWTETQLDDIDFNFLEDNLGTEHGSMIIEPFATCPIAGTCPPLPTHMPAILGSIEEFGDGTRANRVLYHDLIPNSANYQPR